jgi:phage baseplate assembly protein W
MVFSLNSDATVGLIETAVHEALVRWEPRINLLAVTATPDPGQPTLLHIAITYQVRSTNSRYNLVYPFFLES